MSWLGYDHKGEGVVTYTHNWHNFKTRPDLSTNCRDIESHQQEITSQKTHTTIVSILYRPPNGDFQNFENFLANSKNCNKNVYIPDFNLNLLDHSLSKIVQHCLSLICQNSFIPAINKPTRVTRKTSTIIDHIFSNLSVNTNFKKIFKTDISGHFPSCLLQQTSTLKEENKATYITKTVINNNAIKIFKQKLY